MHTLLQHFLLGLINFPSVSFVFLFIIWFFSFFSLSRSLTFLHFFLSNKWVLPVSCFLYTIKQQRQQNSLSIFCILYTSKPLCLLLPFPLRFSLASVNLFSFIFRFNTTTTTHVQSKVAFARQFSFSLLYWHLSKNTLYKFCTNPTHTPTQTHPQTLTLNQSNKRCWAFFWTRKTVFGWTYFAA